MQKPLVIVTGASSGIGRSTALEFSKAGHPLLLVARRVEKLEALEIDNAICSAVDVTDVDAFVTAVREAEDRFGPPDCLVNNAGTMFLGLLHEQDPAQWKQMFDVNVLGLLNGMHVVLKDMIERTRGTVVNIGSTAGRQASANYSVYSGTKFAVHAISEGMRQEVGKHNVRIITVAPGLVETELYDHTEETVRENILEKENETIGAALAPEDVARVVKFAYDQPQEVCIHEIVVAATRRGGS